MNKDVLITLKNVQSVDADHVETELITLGTFMSLGEDGYKIIYDESMVTSHEGTKTSLSCYGNRAASMERTGVMSANFMIEKDKKHHCHYGTPYGDFVIGIFTHEIINELTDSGGNLYFKYTLDVNSSYISDNEVYVHIKSFGSE